MAGTIKQELSANKSYITIKKPKGNNPWEHELILNTNKKDLKINEVVFVTHDQSSRGPSWQSTLPIHLDNTLTKLDGEEDDGFFNYTLNLSVMFSGENTTHGRFVIKTNHPKKPEISINGFIEAK